MKFAMVDATIVKVHRHAVLLPGHRFGIAPLIKDIEFGGLIADKAFCSNWIIEELNDRKAKVVVSQHQGRAQPLDIDKDIYK